MASLNLDRDEIQILGSILLGAKAGMEAELKGQIPGRLIPGPERAKQLQDGVDVCDKIINGLQNPQPPVIIPPTR